MGEDTIIAKLNLIDAQIKHEDDLIGLRMSWLVISQSFLFGTFATLVGLKGVVSTSAGAAVRLLLTVIPVVGVFLPFLVLVAVGAATYAIWQWRAEGDRICKMAEAKELDWPALKHQNLVTVLGHLLPIAVSVGFLAAWFVILYKLET
ncbi:MAG TPA: hypothetical protein VML36_05875 [Nitrospiria bacterium]|nr:hypothetical protein [Nitrospiria bacterium]